MTGPMRKKCSKCGEVKPLDGFHKNKSKKDGVASHCKPCIAKYGRRYYEANREELVERQRLYYEENREKIAESSSRYREENLEKELERVRRYYEANREIIKAKVAKRHGEEQHLTGVFATAPRQAPYLPAEDALILADDGMTIYQKAIELGRTHKSVSRRREKLLAKLNA